MSGRGERDVEGLAGVARNGSFFTEFEDAFDPFAGDARVHEFGGGRAEDDFAMERSVVRMGVTDEADFVFGDLGFVRIQPETKRGQKDSATVELDGKR